MYKMLIRTAKKYGDCVVYSFYVVLVEWLSVRFAFISTV